MADRPHLRLANHTDLANDDPFAELTKIMGFDPRQTARPASTPEPVQAVAADSGFDEMDLSIDLEKELMGDFSDDMMETAFSSDPAPNAEPVLAAPRIPFVPIVDEAPLVAAAPTASDELAFDEDWFHDEDADSQAAAAIESSDPQMWDDGPREDAPTIALADHELELSTASGPAHENEMVAETVAGSEPAFEVENGGEMLEAAELSVHDRPANDVPSAFFAHPEDDAEAEIDIDHIFENALADVDMRFDADHAAVQQLDDVSHHSELDLASRQADGSVSNDDLYGHDEADDDDGGSPPQMSLEDELNALLGNALSRTPTSPAAEHSRPSEGAASGADDAYDPAVEWPEDEPQAVADHATVNVDDLVLEADDLSLESDDFIWEEEPKRDSSESPAAPQSQYAYHDAASVEDDLDLGFDDQAFDDALSVSATDQPVHFSPTTSAPSQQAMEPPVPHDEHNPYAALSALSATLKPQRPWPGETQLGREPADETFHRTAAATGHDAGYQVPVPVFEPEIKYESEAVSAPDAVASARHHEAYVPDVDTLDVPEQAIALADDLDLPDFAYEDEPTSAPSYDDIDAEFTSLLNEMNASDADQQMPARAAHFDEREQDFSRSAAAPVPGGHHVAPAAAAAATVGALGSPYVQPASASVTNGGPAPRNERPPVVHDQADPLLGDEDLAEMEFAYDPDLDEEMALPTFAPIPQRQAPRRGMMVAAVVGGVALLGGIGAFALSFGGGVGSNEPVLVKADDTPVKVKPENPGGTTVPNQDNKVYDTVAGANGAVDTKQETLVSTEEEPVAMPSGTMDEAEDGDLYAADPNAPADAAAVPPSQKAEDRIEQVADAGVDKSVEVAAVAPRKVRTMIVKADGTLVAREEAAPAVEQPLETAAAGMAEPVATVGQQQSTGAVEPAAPAADPQDLPIATAPADEAPVVAAVEPAAPAPGLAPVAKAQQQSSTTPTSVPVAPARPSDQPVDIVGEVKADQVAALSTTAAPGAWAMQIASQPTEAAAKSSYQDLSRRYGAVLNGHPANIIKAEISGKGTFWRVRVAADSRNEAIKLCESYKSAGGNCFVSK